MERRAVYPGSFDPVTSGHLDIVRRAANLFDTLIIAVGKNAGKNPFFSAEERVELLQMACSEWPNVVVRAFDNRLLVDFAQEERAQVIIKGLRAVSDFEYEFSMALANHKLAPHIETMFLMTSAEHLYLSSSLVKEIARLGGDVSSLVPPIVESRLRDTLREANDLLTGNGFEPVEKTRSE